MPFRSRTLAREMGAAFAVMAIYVLTLLLPLHQAAGLQRDLASIGFETAPDWSICGALAQNKDGNTAPATVKCAASGIAKNELPAIEPEAMPAGVVRVGEAVFYAAHASTNPRAVAPHVGQARAPPALV